MRVTGGKISEARGPQGLLPLPRKKSPELTTLALRAKGKAFSIFLFLPIRFAKPTSVELRCHFPRAVAPSHQHFLTISLRRQSPSAPLFAPSWTARSKAVFEIRVFPSRQLPSVGVKPRRAAAFSYWLLLQKNFASSSHAGLRKLYARAL